MENKDYLLEYQKLGLKIPLDTKYKGANEQTKEFAICSILKHVETSASTVSIGYQKKA